MGDKLQKCYPSFLQKLFNAGYMQRDSAGPGSLIDVLKTWVRAHEEAQVVLASVLVVVGLWWLVRAVLSLVINLLCPLLVVLLAVMCVPQLRAPLLGQNYPAVAGMLRNILSKLAENIPKT